MTALSQNATQRNFLSLSGFKLVMKRAPNIQLFIQEINIPGMSSTPPSESTPNISIPFGGEQMTFDTLDITFKVGEDLGDYLEISGWMRDISGLSRTGYKTLTSKPIWTAEGLKSDIILMLLNSSKEPIFEIVFHDAFPISLGSLNFTSVEDTVQYADVRTSFKYTDFDIIKV